MLFISSLFAAYFTLSPVRVKAFGVVCFVVFFALVFIFVSPQPYFI